jgi:hypothetical protein
MPLDKRGLSIRSYHVPARCRRIAGRSGFLTFIQSRDGPDQYSALSRFDTTNYDRIFAPRDR